MSFAAASAAAEASRQDSRKRRRVSERRRVFSRVGAATEWGRGSAGNPPHQSGSLSSPDHSSLSSGAPVGSRSDSPSFMSWGELGGGGSGGGGQLKIQFQITVAPENEPLVVGYEPSTSTKFDGEPASLPTNPSRKASVGDQIHERLQRTASSVRRRHQLMALHKQAALEQANEQQVGVEGLPAGRQERAATIAGGATPTLKPASIQLPRELIYFKRDGQRFGHEFTLKLATERTYRCLLKLRPLMPLLSISVQGQQVPFADCSRRRHAPGGGRGGVASTSAPAVGGGGAGAWQEGGHSGGRHQLGRAMTSQDLASRGLGGSSLAGAAQQSLLEAQQSQMLRHFAPAGTLQATAQAGSLQSAAHQHLSDGQLLYMFDWSAKRFEPTRNKRRTQVQTVLRFKSGQVLALPMQVKFYLSECRQHLNWGSQLHYIDYECQLDQMGQISLQRVHYY